MGSARFDAWVASLDNPPTEKDKHEYIEKFKTLPTAVSLGGGWWFAGPLDDPFGAPWNELYQVLHDSGCYSRELLIDKAQDDSSARHAMLWARQEMKRGTKSILSPFCPQPTHYEALTDTNSTSASARK